MHLPQEHVKDRPQFETMQAESLLKKQKVKKFQNYVDVDVMMSGLVPFLLCPLLQGPCVEPLRSETNFLRWTPSTWRTGTNTLVSPGSRQPCWQSSCHSFRGPLARAIRCDVALTESKHTGCQAIRWEVAPHLPALRGFLPSRPHGSR